ncbi:MAG: lactonase family protein [Armatimonadetes bacterium]|nr:lactonase family protein [Armatimonadota bacterium]
MTETTGKRSLLYVGTYSLRGSEGIYALDFDGDTGALTVRGVVANLRNPSFLALHPRGPWLYAISEAEGEGVVVAIAVSGAEGRTLNQQSTRGRGPCHVAVDPFGEWLATANYGSGSVSLHPLAADGSVGAASDFVQHSGSGPRADRQEGPHAHSVNFDPTGRFLVAADLGTDRLMVYALDRASGTLSLHQEVVLQPGAGPRHFTFDGPARHAYAINELDNTVVTYDWDAADGLLTAKQTISTLPSEFAGTSYTADIHIHPSGQYLYGTNRGHDSLAVFAVDPDSGALRAAGHVPTYGKHPRNFGISPDGRWVLVGNQDTDNIVAFQVRDNGAHLERVGESFALPAPVCLLFVPGG